MADFDASEWSDPGVFDDVSGHPPIGDADYGETIAAAAGDIDPPIVEHVVPPAHRFDVAQFDVFESTGVFRAIVCMVGYNNEPIPSDVVHLDAGALVGFARAYTGTRELVEPGRYRYRVKPVNGWPLLDTRFHALPIDGGGNIG